MLFIITIIMLGAKVHHFAHTFVGNFAHHFAYTLVCPNVKQKCVG